IANDCLVLDSEQTSSMVSGEACGLVAEKIDGSRTPSLIVDELAGEVAPEVVFYTLMQLEQKGHLVDAAVEPITGEAPQGLWESLGLSARGAHEALGSASVSLEALDGLDTTLLAECLGQLSIAVKICAEFRVVVTSNYLHSILRERNREALALRRPW